MHLSYHGEHHYNSVRAIGDEGGGPAMVIMLHNPGSGKDPGDAAAKGAGEHSPFRVFDQRLPTVRLVLFLKQIYNR